MEGDLDQGKEERQRKVNEILVCSRRVNMNFGRRKTKGLAMKRRTIARYRKGQRTLKSLQRHQVRDATTSHQEYRQR